MKAASAMGALPSPGMSRAPSNTRTAAACCAAAVAESDQHTAKKIPTQASRTKNLVGRDAEFTIRIETFLPQVGVRSSEKPHVVTGIVQKVSFDRRDSRIIRPTARFLPQSGTGGKCCVEQGPVRKSPAD